MHLCGWQPSEEIQIDASGRRQQSKRKKPFSALLLSIRSFSCVESVKKLKKQMKMDSHATNGLEHSSRWKNKIFQSCRTENKCVFFFRCTKWRPHKANTSGHYIPTFWKEKRNRFMVFLLSSAGKIFAFFFLVVLSTKIKLMLEFGFRSIHSHCLHRLNNFPNVVNHFPPNSTKFRWFQQNVFKVKQN